ncbi:TnsA-like heteromeric transposase endonuclease subunit [Streptomyces sp. NPDC058877]|uniref:TnsA-like heteromeric transposase endonuclease subunit n=1 Tax=unclassified Streptomyces TaxID=2593676 RepID=UPI0036A9FA26
MAYIDRDGGEHRVDLCDAAAVPFEGCRPVRSFPSWKGQRNYPGLWWAATLGRHVGYESWLERDHAMLLDFDQQVTAFASQPMWLFWTSGGRRRSHAPDWFARKADGTGLVVDCRPLNRIKPRDAEAFAATGWRPTTWCNSDLCMVPGHGAAIAQLSEWRSSLT